jgi:hypothetical protein
MRGLTIDVRAARKLLCACIASLACALASSAAGAGDCLKANVDDQAAEGRLVIARAKDAADRPERPYILELAAAACLEGSDEDDRVESTRTIHIYSSNERVHGRLRSVVGKTIRVRGNPFAAHTSHHHAPIVMNITTIEAR